MDAPYLIIVNKKRHKKIVDVKISGGNGMEEEELEKKIIRIVIGALDAISK